MPVRALLPLMSSLAFAAISMVAGPAFAIELYTWQPYSSHPPFVIAVREGERPESAARRYVNGLEADPQFRRLTEDFRELPIKNFAKLRDADFHRRALFVVNYEEDLRPGFVMEYFSQSFEKAGQKAYALPLLANIDLTPAETAEFIQKLNDRFEHFVHQGGADIDPKIYGEVNTHSRQVVPRRDAFEAALLRRKIRKVKAEEGNHRISAVCRGAQLTAAILGYKLVQDVNTFVRNHIDHGPGAPKVGGEEPGHDARLLKTTQPFVRAWLGDAETVSVNTYHHQAVVFKEGGILEIGAIAPDGVTEAMISKNGRIRLFQFHPEILAHESKGVMKETGEKILAMLAAPPSFRPVNACRALFGR